MPTSSRSEENFTNYWQQPSTGKTDCQQHTVDSQSARVQIIRATDLLHKIKFTNVVSIKSC